MLVLVLLWSQILLCNYKKNYLCEGMVRQLDENKYVCLYRVLIWFQFVLSRGPRTSTDYNEPGNFDLFMRDTYQIQKNSWKSSFYCIELFQYLVFIHTFSCKTSLYGTRFRGCFFWGGEGSKGFYDAQSGISKKCFIIQHLNKCPSARTAFAEKCSITD